MRFAEGMWEIALKHESYVATEMVLKELLEIQRLDFGDRYQAGGKAIKRFLSQSLLWQRCRLPIFGTLNSSNQLREKTKTQTNIY